MERNLEKLSTERFMDKAAVNENKPLIAYILQVTEGFLR